MDELDRILSSDEVLEPSSGFALSAMRAVREAAAEPPPLPFPWGRFIAGFVTCSTLTAVGAAVALRAGLSLATLPAPAPQLALVGPELAYAAVTILGSVCTLLAARARASATSPTLTRRHTRRARADCAVSAARELAALCWLHGACCGYAVLATAALCSSSAPGGP